MAHKITIVYYVLYPQPVKVCSSLANTTWYSNIVPLRYSPITAGGEDKISSLHYHLSDAFFYCKTVSREAHLVLFTVHICKTRQRRILIITHTHSQHIIVFVSFFSLHFLQQLSLFNQFTAARSKRYE